jgi:hypothetical protein
VWVKGRKPAGFQRVHKKRMMGLEPTTFCMAEAVTGDPAVDCASELWRRHAELAGHGGHDALAQISAATVRDVGLRHDLVSVAVDERGVTRPGIHLEAEF